MFDDVANDQRKVIYQQRTEILGTEDLGDAVRGMFADAVGGAFDAHAPQQGMPQDWDLAGLAEALQRDFGVALQPADWLAEQPEIEHAALRERVVQAAVAAYAVKVERVGAPVMRHVERDVVLRTLDQHWRDHLAAMDYLRQGIHLRGYAQKDYRYEYKREAFELFTAMLERVKFDAASVLARIEVRTQEQVDREEAERRERLMRALQLQHAEAQSALGTPEPAAPAPAGGGAAAPAPGAAAAAPFVREVRKVGRNEPCPCGSGRKYKHCHGALDDGQ
jgi:preprotein translocase subunit SecA